jgi:hypothetical protein
VRPVERPLVRKSAVDRRYAPAVGEQEHDADDPSPPASTTPLTFGDIAPFGGFRRYLARHLVVLG